MQKKIHFIQIQNELLQLLRGKRSALQMSRRLGFKTNQYHRWENEHSMFMWQDFLLLCEKQKIDLRESMQMGLHYSGPVDKVNHILKHFFGNLALQKIAQQLSVSSSTVSRWKSGQMDLPFEQFLKMVGQSQYSLTDFFEKLIPNMQIEILLKHSLQNTKEKNLFVEYPWMATVIRCFDLVRYQNLKTHQNGFVSDLLGISLQQEKLALEKLESLQMIEKKPDGKYKSTSKQLNTETGFEGWKKLRQYCLDEAQVFLNGLPEPSSKSVWGYKIFSCHPEAFESLKSCYLRFYQELDKICQDYSDKNNGGSDQIKIFSMQLLDVEDVAISRRK